jgi:hypothetical protein
VKFRFCLFTPPLGNFHVGNRFGAGRWRVASVAEVGASRADDGASGSGWRGAETGSMAEADDGRCRSESDGEWHGGPLGARRQRATSMAAEDGVCCGSWWGLLWRAREWRAAVVHEMV